jgi:predicted TIM-barrel fold metal-dependent hydrolase
MKTSSNLHVDISGWQERIHNHGSEFVRAVRLFMDSLGSDRVHFGTDDPMFDPVHPKERWMATVESLAHRPDDPTFTQEEIDRLMGESVNELID